MQISHLCRHVTKLLGLSCMYMRVCIWLMSFEFQFPILHLRLSFFNIYVVSNEILFLFLFCSLVICRSLWSLWWKKCGLPWNLASMRYDLQDAFYHHVGNFTMFSVALLLAFIPYIYGDKTLLLFVLESTK